MEDNFDLEELKPQNKRINARTKGHTFERKICKILNTHFNTKEFCRTPGSGAFASTHNLPQHIKITGDLITPLNFKFFIECKKGYNKENLSSIFRPNSELLKFIKTNEKISKSTSQPWLLIWQQDNSVVLAIFKGNFLGDYPYDHLNLTLWDKEFIITPLSELLKLKNEFFFLEN